MYRTLVILRHTFRDAIVQPIYSLLLGLAAVILVVFSLLPFFTLGEDTRMFKSAGLDVILPTIILLYIAGNLSRFLFPLEQGAHLKNALAQAAAFVLPYLQTFDLRQVALFREISVPGTEFADVNRYPNAVGLGTLWGY